MSFNTTISDAPSDQKLVPVPVTLLNFTLQLEFMEYPVALGSGASYSFEVVDSTASNFYTIFLDDLGNVFLQIGAIASTPAFIGIWTPDNGAHKVHGTVDGAGTPRLFIDDVEIVLTPIGPLLPIVLASTNNVAVTMTPGVAGAQTASVTRFMMTTGELPSETEFCCPA